MNKQDVKHAIQGFVADELNRVLTKHHDALQKSWREDIEKQNQSLSSTLQDVAIRTAKETVLQSSARLEEKISRQNNRTAWLKDELENQKVQLEGYAEEMTECIERIDECLSRIDELENDFYENEDHDDKEAEEEENRLFGQR